MRLECTINTHRVGAHVTCVAWLWPLNQKWIGTRKPRIWRMDFPVCVVWRSFPAGQDLTITVTEIIIFSNKQQSAPEKYLFSRSRVGTGLQMVADNDEWRMLSCSGGAGNGESDVSLFRQKSCGYLTWLAFSAVVLKSCQGLADNYPGRGAGRESSIREWHCRWKWLLITLNVRLYAGQWQGFIFDRTLRIRFVDQVLCTVRVTGIFSC